ncbi:MAG: class I tRNA ligase family protein, partial [Candidatus Aenigmarchaeota archaeon]|nr:class I tRNA ligase family protein [Candidatus Aenigmarchaeota archaeon]
GKELEGLKCEPLLDIPLQKEFENCEEAHRVVLSIPIMKKKVAGKIREKKEVEGETEFGHLVDISTGTGIVHIAPGHGVEDNEIGKHYNLPDPSPVNEQGELEESTGMFKGNKTGDANAIILDHLESKNSLFYKTTLLHSSPVCWRCKTPLIYRKSKQWLVKLDTLRDKILKEIKSVKWMPEFVEEQFANVIRNSPDWPVARQRYWGIPLPVWICEKCDSIKVIGSREELKKHATKELHPDFDISVSVVDDVKLKCDCGGEMIREKDIMDVWFDSGCSPFASLGYPFKNKDKFEKFQPVDLIDESQDQVRGWFYYLMVCGVALFGKAPYKSVCMNGWTLDEKGDKMSKSVGNVIWAEEAYKELGADITRLYLCSATAPWETLKVSLEEAKTTHNSLNTIWNLVSFVKSYGIAEQTDSDKIEAEELVDKWLISGVNSLVLEVTDDLENFRFHYGSRKILDFVVNDFSRIYIKLVRDRAESKEVGKIMLYTLDRVLKLLAPIAPFVTDELYNQLHNKSVHLSEWPIAEEEKINKDLEKKFEVAKEISGAVNNERQKQGVRLRLPVRKATVFG